MKRFWTTPLLGIAAVAMQGLLAGSVQAANFFQASLDSAQEVAPAGVTNSPVTGFATLELFEAAPGDFDLSYSLTVGEGLDFAQLADGVALEDIQGDNAVTRLHIHNGDRGVNGPVVFGIFNPSLDDPTVTFNGDGSTTIAGVWNGEEGPGLLDDFVGDLLAADPGEDLPLYFNVHTVADPAGAIRGQIEAVPEPSVVLGTLLVLGSTAILKRRETVSD